MNASSAAVKQGESWSTPSKALHASTGMLIVGLATAGFVMADLEEGSALRLLLSRLHTAFGFILMLLVALRLVVRWRGTNPAPLPLPPLHRRGVAAVHALLYVNLFALGASGFLTGALSTWPDYLRGALASAPQLESLWSREAHEILVISLLTFVALHVGGVLVQEVRGGGTLRRMLPFSRAPR